MEHVKIMMSKSGLPCLCESGGGWTRSGCASLICGKDFEKKKAIYVFHSGSLACGNHAVIPISVGDHVVKVWLWHGCYEVSIYQITKIDRQNLEATLAEESAEVLPYDYHSNPAIAAAIAKCNDYHCRCPYYIR